MLTRRAMVIGGGALAATASRAAPDSETAPRATPVADGETAPPDPVGFRPGAVAEVLAAGEALPGLRALAASRHGRLVAERYYGGASAESLLPVNSATKSVCSMLVGLALRDGRIASLDDTVAALIPEAVAEVPGSPAAAVTLRQILSGRSGLAFDPLQFNQLASARPLVRQALSRPGVALTGWSYNDAMVALLAPILERAQGGAALAVLAQRQLFDPLGIDRFAWRRGGDGKSLAPGGLALRTRDLLKLAALMLEGGRWRGEPVLPEPWVAASLAPAGPATWRAGPIADVGYGLLWFTGRLHGQRVAWAWGYGGQFSLLAPELKLAVATAATSPPPHLLRGQTDAIMALVGHLVEAAMV